MSGSTKTHLLKTSFKIFVIVPICIVVAISVLTAGFLFGSYIYFARDIPTVSELERYEPKVPCRVSDSPEGHQQWKPHCQAPEVPVEIDLLPRYVVNAFVAAEDISFFERDSPNIVNVLRSFLPIRYSRYPPRISTGGWLPSPFSSMIAKNMLPDERRLRWKIRKMVLEIRLERTWDKKRILRVFLNEIYLGNGCYGLGAASHRYFGKPAEQLTVAEAALIAGLVSSPSRYNPINCPDKADQRKQLVLERMLRAGFLSPEECRQAKGDSLSIHQ